MASIFYQFLAYVTVAVEVLKINPLRIGNGLYNLAYTSEFSFELMFSETT